MSGYDCYVGVFCLFLFWLHGHFVIVMYSCITINCLPSLPFHDLLQTLGVHAQMCSVIRVMHIELTPSKQHEQPEKRTAHAVLYVLAQKVETMCTRDRWRRFETTVREFQFTQSDIRERRDVTHVNLIK